MSDSTLDSHPSTLYSMSESEEPPDFAGKFRILKWRRVEHPDRLHGKLAVEFLGLNFVIHGIDLVINDSGVPRANLPRRSTMTADGVEYFNIGTFRGAAARQAFSDELLDQLLDMHPELEDLIPFPSETSQ